MFSLEFWVPVQCYRCGHTVWRISGLWTSSILVLCAKILHYFQSLKLEIEALKSELKSKQTLKRNLIHQKRALVDENRDLIDQKSALEGELKGIKLEPKKDECPICFETVSLERKWTAFIPCGHRTCAECARQISSLPRTTNCKKCPNCRKTITNFLVLEGIYES